ncbi:MAG: glycosyltransferase family 39 protein [Acidobacteriota bacterium]|nr:MAG: glycosyltransferase family 39 protein [Acidobacteriota bacterium]
MYPGSTIAAPVRFYRSATDWITDPERSDRAIAVVLVLHFLALSVFSILARGNLDGHGDMAENYAWGQEWQLGYHKHPPFFAWVVAAWFILFPNTDWAYFLLSSLNVVIGLAAVWFLSREFLTAKRSLIAVVLLAFLPYYTFLAIKFNANAILLSLWPLAALFFVRSLRSRSVFTGVLFGLAAGLSVLSKYFSFSLLAGLFLVAVFSRHRKEYFSSLSPYATGAAFILCIAPHAYWLVSHEFLPVQYAADHKIDLPGVLKSIVLFALLQGAYLLPAAIAVVAAVGLAGWRRSGLLKRVRAAWTEHRLMTGILCLPFLLTIVSAGVLQLELSAIWGMPLWFLLGAFLAATIPEETVSKAYRRSILAILAFHVILVFVAAPLTVVLDRASGRVSPREELSTRVTSEWRALYGTELRIVAGTRPLAESVSFYSADTPSLFIDFNERYSPWISRSRISREGIAIVCAVDDAVCEESARKWFGDACDLKKISVKEKSVFYRDTAVEFKVCLVPPGN